MFARQLLPVKGILRKFSTSQTYFVRNAMISFRQKSRLSIPVGTGMSRFVRKSHMKISIIIRLQSIATTTGLFYKSSGSDRRSDTLLVTSAEMLDRHHSTTSPRAVKRARHNNYRVTKPGEP